MNLEKIGVYSFYAGLILAIGAALLSPQGISAIAALILGVLGIIVGLLNVVDKEVKLFLLASLVLIVSASALALILAAIPGIGNFVPALMEGIIIFVAPGAAVVALKAIWDITKSK